MTHLTPPDQLSVASVSPFYDKDWISRIDKVFVDGVHLPNCRAYCISQGWAANRVDGINQPKKYGKITIKLK